MCRTIVGSLAVVAACWAQPAEACGPDFPTQLLLGRGPALLSMPAGDAADEIDWGAQGPARFRIVPDESDTAAQALKADLDTLRAALRARGGTEEQIALGAEAVKAIRSGAQAKTPLPAEFQLYAESARLYRQGDPMNAVLRWKRLLALPAPERAWRSTWAAFMLGRWEWESARSERAVEWFRMVRELALTGFADDLGLAATSFGWEARVEWSRGDWGAAVRLYRQQAQAGDPTGAASLELTGSRLVSLEEGALERSVRDPDARRLAAGWLVSRSSARLGSAWADRNPKVERWLKAVEAAGVKDVEGADRLAWAAYRYGSFEAARRWLKLATATPVATWLSAKFALMDGNEAKAAELLSKAVEQFPDDEWKYQFYDPPSLGFSEWGPLRPRSRIKAELAILDLKRSDWLEAADLLVRSGYWTDASYVAERVLEVDELKHYVDSTWADGEREPEPWKELFPMAKSRHPELRALLGRRLARAGRVAEAVPYLPAELRASATKLAAFVAKGKDGAAAAEARASALWEAAKLSRHAGMELMGTGVAPDWSMFEGNYSVSDYEKQIRESMESSAPPVARGRMAATQAELARVKASAPEPDERFHYRKVAAALALEAARLLPRSSEKAAIMMCHAALWSPDRALWKEFVARGRVYSWGGGFGQRCPKEP